MADLDAIVQQLEAERDRIDAAIRALRGIGQTSSGSQPKRHISAVRARTSGDLRDDITCRLWTVVPVACIDRY